MLWLPAERDSVLTQGTLGSKLRRVTIFIFLFQGSNGGVFISDLNFKTLPSWELTIFQAFRFIIDLLTRKFSCLMPPNSDIIKVKRFIQGHNKVTGVQDELRSCDLGHPKNDALSLWLRCRFHKQYGPCQLHPRRQCMITEHYFYRTT